jgi:hypothetical protein
LWQAAARGDGAAGGLVGVEMAWADAADESASDAANVTSASRSRDEGVGIYFTGLKMREGGPSILLPVDGLVQEISTQLAIHLAHQFIFCGT